MGLGVDLARSISPEHAAAIDSMKDQLLIVLIKRLGGTIEVPANEIDDTAQSVLSMSLNPATRVFKFSVEKKS